MTDPLSLLVVPPDWFSNADSLRESFRIANSLDWANIDLTCHPGQYSTIDYSEIYDAQDAFIFCSGFTVGICLSRITIFHSVGKLF